MSDSDRQSQHLASYPKYHREVCRRGSADVACQVADCALTSLRVHESGGLVAVGCADGTTSVLQLSSSLVDLQSGEKAATLAVRTGLVLSHKCADQCI